MPEKKRERADFRLPVVIPVLFYNGEQHWTVPTQYRKYQKESEQFGKYVLNFEYYLVDLKRIRKEYILESNTLIDNILALDQNRKSQELLNILERVIKRLNELSEGDRLDFRRWLEQVLIEAARGEDRKEIGKLIAALQKGDDEVIHGLQRTIMEEYDAGVRSGRRQGVEQGAKALIETCRELKCTREDTAVRVKNKFRLSEKDTMRYMNKFWPMEEI